jgi:type II secretory pathway component PulF
MYPMILIIVAVSAVAVMLWTVVPVFAKMFHDMDAQLPAITQYVVGASDYISKYGIYGLGAIVAFIFGFKRYLKTDNGRRYVLGALMTMPSVGQLMIEMSMYRFASNISLLLKSGVPLLRSVHYVRSV